MLKEGKQKLAVIRFIWKFNIDKLKYICWNDENERNALATLISGLPSSASHSFSYSHVFP